MEYILKTDGLSKSYGGYKALSGLSMRIPKGSIYGLVGKNGSGKTTLIRLITGLQSPTEGEFTLYGVSSRDKSIHKVRRHMGAVVETPSLYGDLSARENLREQCRVLGVPDFSCIPELLKLVGLENTGKKRASHFSLGMKQRLGIAIALCGSPDLLILDEPINGLDPQGIVEIRELILKLNRERDITVLISSHILEELSKLATHFGFIDQGQIIREISAAELESDCRKCVRLEVTDVNALARVLDSLGLEYTIWTDQKADVFGPVEVTDLALRLAEQGCSILSMTQREESLENYYINLVGGGRHA